MLKDTSDEELMLAYQLGDESAFTELYTRHSARVLGFLRSKVSDEAKARDIFQAAFLKLHRSRGRYNPALPFVPWLFMICRNELFDASKKEKSLKEEITDTPPEPESAVAVAAVDLSRLKPQQQQAVAMRFTQDASFEEIAAALHTSPANARQLLSRALKSLRSFYDKK